MSARIEPLEYYGYSSSGIVFYDPKKEEAFEPFWAIVECDLEIINYYRWHLLRRGIAIHKGSRWGCHISWNRGEQPSNLSAWGKYEGLEIDFKYSNFLRWDNGRHAWIDIYCPKLNALRVELGLRPWNQMSFHLTIGRLVMPQDNLKELPTYPYKDR
jgi:hypothetical protein